MVPLLAMRSAIEVAGVSAGTQRARMSAWKNRAMACWTVVMVLPAVRSSPCRAPCSSPCQNRAACGCWRRISVGSLVLSGFATHVSTSSRVRPVRAAAWK